MGVMDHTITQSVAELSVDTWASSCLTGVFLMVTTCRPDHIPVSAPATHALGKVSDGGRVKQFPRDDSGEVGGSVW